MIIYSWHAQLLACTWPWTSRNVVPKYCKLSKYFFVCVMCDIFHNSVPHGLSTGFVDDNETLWREGCSAVLTPNITDKILTNVCVSVKTHVVCLYAEL